MNLLTVDHITKVYTQRELFHDASFYLQDGEKVGIIGINGTGKSTLLKIMAGLEEPDAGNVVRANHLVIRYLPQMPEFDPQKGALENVLSYAQIGSVHQQEDREEHEKWNLESNAKSMMTRLGIYNFDEPVGHLSGGQRKRLALVAVLLTPCDVLLLDEPTNHLDAEMAEWLENYLKNYRGAMVMVTHDRYFLDSVCNRIVEVDKGQIYSYETNYSGYLAAKQEREDIAWAGERKRQSILRKEIEWMQRGARARSTKQKAHIQRYEALRDQKKPDAGEVTIGQTIKIGYYTQEIEQDENAGIAYMDPELRVIDYIKNTAEYVRTEDGLVSASAMLDQFLFPPEEQYGQIKKLSGGEKRRLNLLRVLMEAPNVLILDEPTNDLDITTLTILEDYLDHYDGIVITVSHDRYFLDRVVHRIFAFEGNGKLCQYEGGYTDYHRRAEEEGKFVDTAGDSFRKNEETANVQEKQATEDSRSTWKHENKLKFSYKEQKEYETIEDDIAALETRLGEIDGEMASCARDFVKLNELTEEKTQLETQLEEKMDRWTYLEELAAKILQQNA